MLIRPILLDDDRKPSPNADGYNGHDRSERGCVHRAAEGHRRLMTGVGITLVEIRGRDQRSPEWAGNGPRVLALPTYSLSKELSW